MKNIVQVLGILALAFLMPLCALAAPLLPSSYDSSTLPKSLPYTRDGVTYQHAIAWPHTGPTDHWVAYYNGTLQWSQGSLIMPQQNACFYQIAPIKTDADPNAECAIAFIYVNECKKTYYSDVSIYSGSAGTLNPTADCASVEYDVGALLIKGTKVPLASFRFPIGGSTPYDHPVSSVMDHAMSRPYSRNGVVQAYNGEEGRASVACHCYSTGLRCDQETYRNCAVAGYGKAGNTQFLEGILNYNDQFLYYDGHPGYDYPAVVGTNILAPAGGTLCVATPTVEKPKKPGVWRDNNECTLPSVIGQLWSNYHTFYVLHGTMRLNGIKSRYMSVFLHNQKLARDIQKQVNAHGYAKVSTSEHIAHIGNTSPRPIGYHMHLEMYRDDGGGWVRIDPYGNGTKGVLWKK